MVQAKRLCILCGGGGFPLLAAQKAQQLGLNPFVILIKNHAEEGLKSFPHAVVTLGQIGRVKSLIQQQSCQQLMFIGTVIRPNMWRIKPDMGAVLSLPRLVKAYRGGDNHLLTHLARLFESEHVKLIGIHDLLPELLAQLGTMGHIKPSPLDVEDIVHGAGALATLSPYDLGQGLILSHKNIIAVEGAEGTDGLLKRVQEMRATKRVHWSNAQGVLVKAPKTSQDNRLDMPAIGLETLKNAHAAGLKGVAVKAGATLIIEAEAMLDYANKNGLFVYGF